MQHVLGRSQVLHHLDPPGKNVNPKRGFLTYFTAEFFKYVLFTLYSHSPSDGSSSRCRQQHQQRRHHLHLPSDTVTSQPPSSPSGSNQAQQTTTSSIKFAGSYLINKTLQRQVGMTLSLGSAARTSPGARGTPALCQACIHSLLHGQCRVPAVHWTNPHLSEKKSSIFNHV